MELPICCAILDCGKSLSEMLAEPWTNIAVQPPDSCANQRACVLAGYITISWQIFSFCRCSVVRD